MNYSDLGRNTVVYVLGNLFLKMFSFLMVPLYLNYMSPEQYGFIFTVISTSQVLMIFMDFGMRSAVIRYCGGVDKGLAVVASSLFLNILCIIVVVVVSMYVADVFFYNIYGGMDIIVSDYIIYTYMAASFRCVFNTSMSYYVAIKNVFIYNVFNGLASVFLFLNTFMFFIFSDNYVEMAIKAYIVTYACFSLFSIFFIYRSGNDFRISLDAVRKNFVFGFPLIFYMLSQIAINISNIYFIKFFLNFESVGIYSLSIKFLQFFGIMLNIPFQYAFAPILFASKNDKNLNKNIYKIFIYYVVCIIFISIVVVSAAKVFIFHFLSEKYIYSYVLIIYLLPAYMFNSVNYFSELLFNMKLKNKDFAISSFLFGVIDVLLSYYMIKNMGLIGAVLVSDVVAVMLAVLLLQKSFRYFGISIYYDSIFRIVVYFMIYIVLMFVMENVKTNIFFDMMYSLISMIVLGVFAWYSFEEKDRSMIVLHINKRLKR